MHIIRCHASKSHHLSIGDHPDDRLVLSEEANGEQMAKCEQLNDLGITMNSAFTPSANVLTAANKAMGNAVLNQKVIYMPDKGDIPSPIKSVGETST